MTKNTSTQETRILSRTKELRDWLEKNIRELERDLSILEFALRYPQSSPRYAGLTSGEAKAKKHSDLLEQKALKRRLELFCSARELGMDIDAMEGSLLAAGVNIELDIATTEENYSGVMSEAFAKGEMRGKFGQILQIFIDPFRRELRIIVIIKPPASIGEYKFAELLRITTLNGAISFVFPHQELVLRNSGLLTLKPHSESKS